MVTPKQAKGDQIMGHGFCFNFYFLIAPPLNYFDLSKVFKFIS